LEIAWGMLRVLKLMFLGLLWGLKRSVWL